MGTFPRAQFLPQNPPLILPRKSRVPSPTLRPLSGHRGTGHPLPIRWREWGNAFVYVLIVIAGMAYVIFWMWAIGDFISNRPDKPATTFKHSR